MMAVETNCKTTSRTGSTRYRLALSQPIGGCPFTNGYNQDDPLPAVQIFDLTAGCFVSFDISVLRHS